MVQLNQNLWDSGDDPEEQAKKKERVWIGSDPGQPNRYCEYFYRTVFVSDMSYMVFC